MPPGWRIGTRLSVTGSEFRPGSDIMTAALDVSDRGLRRAKQKGAGHTHMLEGLAYDARFERANVGGDVRQFGHA